MATIRTWLVGILCLLSVFDAQATERQSVGLVLSGGGAKGIAHIGIIKALEENGIPIDYVAGTSMGAIVGGLYSAGYTPEQMVELILSEEFSSWSTGKIDKTKTFYYLKPEKTPAVVSFDIGGRDSTSMTANILPESFINPLPMNLGFLKLFTCHTAACEENFDRLFIPFRCVASDVFNKQKIVLRDGNLGDAIRMSMTFPVAFKPIERNGVPIFDGGIYDNFPVDVMREDFAPDIIIGVDVTTHEPVDMGNLVTQLETMVIQDDNYDLPEEQGIKLHVYLKGTGLLDFPKAKEVFAKGYKVAIDNMDSIKSRIQGRVSPATVELRRNAYLSKVPDVVFDSINVTGLSKHGHDYIKHLFTNHDKKPLTVEEFETSYYRAITTGKIKDLLPICKYNKQTGHIDMTLKATAKDDFSVGIGGYATSSANSMLFLSAGYRTMNLNSFSSTVMGWLGQSYLGGYANVQISKPKGLPMTEKLQIVAAEQEYHEDNTLFFDDLPSFITNYDYHANLTTSIPAGRHGKFDLSFGYGYVKDLFFQNNKVDFSNAERDENRFKLGKVGLNYAQNTLDNDFYPSSGHYYNASVSGYLGKRKYLSHADDSPYATPYTNMSWLEAELSGQYYFNPSKVFAFGVKWNALYSTKKPFGNTTSTLVNSASFVPTESCKGEFIPTFRANSYLSLGILPIFKLKDNFQIRSEFYGFAPMRKLVADQLGFARYDGWFPRFEYMAELSA
ncbi:MAG: patatin-like phospholipase family protein, partial [Candidatus Limisoma sp.]